MHEIIWPEGYLPGFTDNFASNEVIVAGLRAEDIWPLLACPLNRPWFPRHSPSSGNSVSHTLLETAA